MGWPRVTVCATVLTSPVWIQAGVKTNIGAVVVGNDRLGFVTEELSGRTRIRTGSWPTPLAIELIDIVVQLLESIRRIRRRTPASHGGVVSERSGF